MGDAFDAAQEEWDRVREIVPGFSNRTGGGRGGEVAPSAGVGGGDAAAAAVLREKPLLTFRTAAEHVKPAAIAFKPSVKEGTIEEHHLHTLPQFRLLRRQRRQYPGGASLSCCWLVLPVFCAHSSRSPGCWRP